MQKKRNQDSRKKKKRRRGEETPLHDFHALQSGHWDVALRPTESNNTNVTEDCKSKGQLEDPEKSHCEWKIEKALEESQTLSDGKIGDACQKKKQGILFWNLDLNKILAKKFFQEILWEKVLGT